MSSGEYEANRTLALVTAIGAERNREIALRVLAVLESGVALGGATMESEIASILGEEKSKVRAGFGVLIVAESRLPEGQKAEILYSVFSSLKKEKGIKSSSLRSEQESLPLRDRAAEDAVQDQVSSASRKLDAPCLRSESRGRKSPEAIAFGRWWQCWLVISSKAKIPAQKAFNSVIWHAPKDVTLRDALGAENLVSCEDRFSRLMDSTRVAAVELVKREPEYRPHPSTWLRSGEWITRPLIALPAGMSSEEFLRVYEMFRTQGTACDYGLRRAWTTDEAYMREAPIRAAIIEHRREYRRLWEQLTQGVDSQASQASARGKSGNMSHHGARASGSTDES